MGNINDNIRSKKLYKSGEVDEAYKDSNGDTVVPTKVAAELDAIDGITEIINDPGVFHVNKHLVKEIENMRLDIEELHGFIKDAFGKDASQAASRGAKGDTGPAGAKGAAGAKGSNGKNGADGNSHLSNVGSIQFNSKANQLEITIGKITYIINPAK
jgi:hypothetical protein